MGRRAVAAMVVAVALGLPACGGGGLFGRQYEYEEDLYLSIDGSAEVIVNTSMPALAFLRGLDVDVDPAARVDTAAIREAYTTDVTQVARVSRPWRRDGRRFVQVRVRVADVRRLHEATPFSWSRYEIEERDGQQVFRQTVGAPAYQPGTLRSVGWRGGELVAFRLHLPSRIYYHNARDVETNATRDVERGNILAWEQLLADRLDAVPVEIEVRMDSQSILYRTLWLFAGAFAGAVVVIAFLVWLTMRRGEREPVPS